MWGACFANRHTFHAPLGLRPPHRSAPPTAVQGVFVGYRFVLRDVAGVFPPHPCIAPRRRVGPFGPGPAFFVAFMRLWQAPSFGAPSGPLSQARADGAAAVGRGPPPRPPLGAGPPPLPLAPRSLRSRPPLTLRAAGASPPWESGVPRSAGLFVALRAFCASRSNSPAKRGECEPPGGGPLPFPRGSALACGSLSSASSSGPRGPSVRWPPPGAYGREPPALRLGPPSLLRGPLPSASPNRVGSLGRGLRLFLRFYFGRSLRAPTCGPAARLVPSSTFSFILPHFAGAMPPPPLQTTFGVSGLVPLAPRLTPFFSLLIKQTR